MDTLVTQRSVLQIMSLLSKPVPGLRSFTPKTANYWMDDFKQGAATHAIRCGGEGTNPAVAGLRGKLQGWQAGLEIHGLRHRRVLALRRPGWLEASSLKGPFSAVSTEHFRNTMDPQLDEVSLFVQFKF